jgi:hypothetical protein
LLPALGAPATANAHFELEPPALPALDQPAVPSFRGPGVACTELQLRPLARCRSRCSQADSPCGPTACAATLEISFVQTGRRARAVSGDGHPGNSISAARRPVPLFFPRGAVVVVAAAAQQARQRAACDAAGYGSDLPGARRRSLCGAAAAIPTVLTAVTSLLFLQMLSKSALARRCWS